MNDSCFDHVDVFYLANCFSVVKLYHEIYQSEIRAIVAMTYRETEYQTVEDLWPWIDYARACRNAIEWNRQNKPKVISKCKHIDIERIKAANDIVAIIQKYTKLRKSGKNFTGICPIHWERHPSFYVYPDEQRWHCFGACNRGGDAIDFIMAVEGVDFKQAVASLGDIR